MEQLKPCPFCGKSDELNLTHLSKSDIIADDWLIECERCQFSQYAIYRKRDYAIAAWNTRAPDEQVRKLREAVISIVTQGEPGRYQDELWSIWQMRVREYKEAIAALEDTE